MRVGVNVGVFVASDHTQEQMLDRTPLDEGSAYRIDLYLTTQRLQETDHHAPGGIRSRSRSKGGRLTYALARAATGIGPGQTL